MILNSSNNKKIIKKYYDGRSSCQVLGCLMINPKLIKSLEYPLDKEDFIGATHKTLFVCIYNLAQQGLQTINLSDIETYLHNTNPLDYIKLFEKYNGEQWILNILEDATIENFDYYYRTVRKYALLRSYLQEGVNVSSILDLTNIDSEINQEQLTEFDTYSIEDIIKHFDRQNLSSKQRFTVREGNKSRKSGDGADELYKIMQQNPNYGYGLESEYLNTATYGIMGNRFLVDTRDTGTGKSRSSVKRLVNLCSPYLWDFEQEKFIENPNGMGNSGLYIGTEMDIYI